MQILAGSGHRLNYSLAGYQHIDSRNSMFRKASHETTYMGSMALVALVNILIKQ